jgi:hypothetical protein
LTGWGKLSSIRVSNVLNDEKKQQAIELGRLGWSLRRIQKTVGVRRETISVYLRAAGIAMRPPRGQIIPAKPASQSDEVITDLSVITLHGLGYPLAGIYWMLQRGCRGRKRIPHCIDRKDESPAQSE